MKRLRTPAAGRPSEATAYTLPSEPAASSTLPRTFTETSRLSEKPLRTSRTRTVTTKVVSKNHGGTSSTTKLTWVAAGVTLTVSSAGTKAGRPAPRSARQLGAVISQGPEPAASRTGVSVTASFTSMTAALTVTPRRQNGSQRGAASSVPASDEPVSMP